MIASRVVMLREMCNRWLLMMSLLRLNCVANKKETHIFRLNVICFPSLTKIASEFS